MQDTRTRRAMLAALMGNVIFGFSFLFSKLGLRFATPSTLLAWRFALAFALMSLALLTGRVKLRLRGKRLWPLGLLGLFEPVLYFLCESYGLMYSTATFSAVMIALIPIASMLFALVFLREIPTRGQVLFGTISILGVVLISVQQAGAGVVQPLGIALLAGAIVSAVGFGAVSRRFSADFTPFTRTYVMMLSGMVFFGAFACVENAAQPTRMLVPLGQPEFLAAIAYLGGVSSVGAFLLINYANGHLTLARVTAFANVTTVVSVFAGVVFLRESIPFVGWIASALILLGVYGVQKLARPLALPPE